MKVLNNAVFGIGLKLAGGIHTVFQFILNAVIAAGLEDRPQDPRSFIRSGIQEVPEFTLRDHRDLLELLFIHVEKSPYHPLFFFGSIDVSCSFNRSAVRIIENDFFLFFSHLSVPVDPLIRRLPINMIHFPLVGKIKIHKAFHGVFRILASQILCISVGSAGFAIQRVTDRVKDRRLPRSGISRDQEQAFFLKLRKV